MVHRWSGLQILAYSKVPNAHSCIYSAIIVPFPLNPGALLFHPKKMELVPKNPVSSSALLPISCLIVTFSIVFAADLNFLLRSAS